MWGHVSEKWLDAVFKRLRATTTLHLHNHESQSKAELWSLEASYLQWQMEVEQGVGEEVEEVEQVHEWVHQGVGG